MGAAYAGWTRTVPFEGAFHCSLGECRGFGPEPDEHVDTMWFHTWNTHFCPDLGGVVAANVHYSHRDFVSDLVVGREHLRLRSSCQCQVYREDAAIWECNAEWPPRAMLFLCPHGL